MREQVEQDKTYANKNNLLAKFSTPLSFSVPGLVRGKGRGRAFARGGIVRVYTDEKTRCYEDAVRVFASKAMGSRPPISGHVEVRIMALFMPPKKASVRRKNAMFEGMERPVSVDADNIAKAALDAMNGIVFTDDKNVARLIVEKKYGYADELIIDVLPFRVAA